MTPSILRKNLPRSGSAVPRPVCWIATRGSVARRRSITFKQQTIQNKETLEEKDPAIRRQHLDELRRTSEDITLHKKFLYRSSLIDSLNSANTIERTPH